MWLGTWTSPCLKQSSSIVLGRSRSTLLQFIRKEKQTKTSTCISQSDGNPCVRDAELTSKKITHDLLLKSTSSVGSFYTCNLHACLVGVLLLDFVAWSLTYMPGQLDQKAVSQWTWSASLNAYVRSNDRIATNDDVWPGRLVFEWHFVE